MMQKRAKSLHDNGLKGSHLCCDISLLMDRKAYVYAPCSQPVNLVNLAVWARHMIACHANWPLRELCTCQ